jgi:hypothetical protein
MDAGRPGGLGPFGGLVPGRYLFLKRIRVHPPARCSTVYAKGSGLRVGFPMLYPLSKKFSYCCIKDRGRIFSAAEVLRGYLATKSLLSFSIAFAVLVLKFIRVEES